MRIVVGLSGGVDSALAAALLQERGFDVVGCFLKVDLNARRSTSAAREEEMGGRALPDPRLRASKRLLRREAGTGGKPGGFPTICPWAEDLPMAHRVAAHLNIPLVVKDVSAEYEREVLKPMVAAYRRGETPNPDTTCNRYVKFDALAAVAREVSAQRIATGHYARIKRSSFRARRGISHHGIEEHVELHRGLDHVKDQSYFLWMLTQEQLAMCEFPIGEWRKEDIRAEAKRRGFPNWDRESTSGVCFLGRVSIVEFLTASSLSLRAQRSNPGTEGTAAPATVVTTDGVVLGTVPAGEAFTIGQRVPIAGQSTPHYVVALCPTSNVGQEGEQEKRRVIVAAPDDPARYTKTITAGSPHWIGAPPMLPFSCTARIRHRQDPVPCVVSLRGSAGDRSNPGLQITFDTPLTGVAPGQAIVLTDGGRVLGGAVIVRTAPSAF